MGAGLYPAGVGGAGFDPPKSYSQRTIVTVAQMPKFDIGTRRIVLDASGNAVTVHPVDHQVAIALGIVQRSLSSAAATGLQVSRVRAARRENAADIVQDMVRVSLAALLKAKDIALDSVVTEWRNGSVAFEVTYRNLRLPTSRPTILTGSA